jgi:DNA-directed RNA polymerase II subunit RPB4
MVRAEASAMRPHAGHFSPHCTPPTCLPSSPRARFVLSRARGGPADFDNVTILLNTEVAIILKQMIEQRRDTGKPPGESLRTMLEYVERFDLMKGSADSVSQVRSIGVGSNFQPLHDYEFVQIVNLGCEDAREAKTLIPSLRKKVEGGEPQLDDATLQSIVDECAKQHAFDEGV